VRDVLGHLAHGEDYHRACLDGTVAAFFARFAGRGGTDLDSVNALGVAGYAALSRARRSPAGVLPARTTAAGSVSEEMAWWAPPSAITPAAGRHSTWPPSSPPTPTTSAWARQAESRGSGQTRRARYSRFALAEAKPHLTIQATGARTLVTDGPDTVEVGDHELAEAVMGRLDETSRLNAKLRELLSIKP
jgi:hypothetical protein